MKTFNHNIELQIKNRNKEKGQNGSLCPPLEYGTTMLLNVLAGDGNSNEMSIS